MNNSNKPNQWKIITDYSKVVITLAIAMLSLTITFSENLFKLENLFGLSLLRTSWIFMGLAILSALLTITFSINFIRNNSRDKLAIFSANSSFFFLTLSVISLLFLGFLNTESFGVRSINTEILTSNSMTIDAAINQNWWYRHQAIVWSTLGGVLIAIIASFLTYFLTNYRISKREKKVYQGVLYSLYIELFWQKRHNKMLRDELSNLLRLSLDKAEFIVDKAPDEFHVKYVEACREKVIEYDLFDRKIIALLSTYINLLIDTNRHIDFTIARSLNLGSDITHRKKLIKGYFDKIEENCTSKIDHAIPSLRLLIEDEIKDYPKDLLLDMEMEKVKKEKSNDSIREKNA